MKTIIFTVAADKELADLPPPAQAQLIDALVRYATTGVGDIKKLAGRPGFRLRSGRYRVIFDEDEFTVLAISIGKRETTTCRRH